MEKQQELYDRWNETSKCQYWQKDAFRCTYTEPEIAHVGLYEKDIKEQKIDADTYTRPLAAVDRCKCDGVTRGFVKMRLVLILVVAAVSKSIVHHIIYIVMTI